jgi:hypothetical protein
MMKLRLAYSEEVESCLQKLDIPANVLIGSLNSSDFDTCQGAAIRIKPGWEM